MKDKLTSFLKRWPKFCNFLKRGYFAFSGMRKRLVGTKLEEKYWAPRHLHKGDDWGNKENDWVRGYWNSRDHSHRSFLMKRIFKFSPSSILEVGCNCGPKLAKVGRRY